MSKSSRVLPRRAKTEAVRAVADSTQERSDRPTRLRKRKAHETDTSDDSNQVSESRSRRTRKSVKLDAQSAEGARRQKETVSRMGRQIPLTFTVRGKTKCELTKAKSSSSVSPLPAIEVSEDEEDREDSNILLREWLERKAEKGNLPGLQWHDKSRQMVRISWKHGSKSCWKSSDCKVFISWARCTGLQVCN